MANAFFVTNAVAQGMLNSTGLAEAIGANGKLNIYSGTAPANADATNSGTLLAALTLASVPFSGFTDTGSAGRATLGAVSSATASATGTASFFRITTSGGTVIAQGTVATSSADLVLNSIAITSGSTVAVSSGTIDMPEG